MKGKLELKVNFTDFWHGFDKQNNFFYNLLIEKYNVVISENPDLLFYSVYTNHHIQYHCTKIFFTGENIRPDFILCDFAFSFDYSSNKRNYRLPLYVLYDDLTKFINKNIESRKVLDGKKKFCCFVVSNNKCIERNNFFIKLSKYRHIDSGGSVFNNIGRLVENKLDFIKEYKFVIAFENASYPGYTTEKVFEPIQQNCVPIYWGNPLVGKDFNTKRMINCHEFPSFDAVIEHIIAVDNDDELYMQYINQPVFANNQINEFAKKENLLNMLDEIVQFSLNKRNRYIILIRPIYFFIRSQIRSTTLKIRYLVTKKQTLKRHGEDFLKKIKSFI